MKAACHLIIGRNGSIRTTKQRPAIGPNEVAIGVTIDIPNRFFERPVFTAAIKVPDDMLTEPAFEAVVELTAANVAQTLKVDVNDVRDGLHEAIAKREQNGGGGTAMTITDEARAIHRAWQHNGIAPMGRALPAVWLIDSVVYRDPSSRRELSERSRRQVQAARTAVHGARADGREKT